MTDNERDMLLTELKTKIEVMHGDLEQIKHVLLEGNGKPPLTEQVLTNKMRLDRLEEERTDKKVPRAVWAGIVISSVLSVAGIIASMGG